MAEQSTANGLVSVRNGCDRSHIRHKAVDDVVARLTSRELEIAILVAQGHANKNIAYRLRISEWTVATYLRRTFAKLNVESRAAMVFRCAPLITASLEPVRGRNADYVR